MAASGFDRRYDPVFQRPDANAARRDAVETARSGGPVGSGPEGKAAGDADDGGTRGTGGTGGTGEGRGSTGAAPADTPAAVGPVAGDLRMPPSTALASDGDAVNFPADAGPEGLAHGPGLDAGLGARLGAGLGDDGDPGDGASRRRMINPFLVALWVVSTALLLAAVWATREVHDGYLGSFVPGAQYGEGSPEETDMDRFARLQYLPHVLAGLYAAAGAAISATLAVHALRWRARSGA